MIKVLNVGGEMNLSVSLKVLFMFVVQTEDNERREKNLEEAKKIVIKKDPSLPEPEAVSCSYFTLFFLKFNALCGYK